ncbi:protein phosphatase 2C domain-containing protein [Azoarcus sp. L1K30]|uniref:PP2C family protein-serine/threonine phosphatase n=1 Tax=Azoarcus sp. L1K30 TaxID=2820277 RepID=UPI002010DC07|nr:protein phosphatase 2C domain-containing protein [Azoarcus sp. L1K30]
MRDSNQAISAMHPSGFDFAGRSDIGLVRSRNEDSIWIDADNGWLLLADGMGGYQGGDVAATLAIATVLERLQRHELGHDGSAEDRMRVLGEGMTLANDAIRLAGASNATLAGMGATMVGAWVDGQQVAFAHVGDSRLYRYRAGVLERLTNDHTVLQAQVDAGLIGALEAQQLPYRGLLTRGLGVAPQVEVDVGLDSICPDDRYLLCSDGLTDMLGDDEIGQLLGLPQSSARIAGDLVDRAIARGGRDNVSVIVARRAG